MKQIQKEDFIYHNSEENWLDKINQNFSELNEKFNNIKLITWPKWEKWEAFKYSDFTPEQLEALKVKWDKWEVWPPWPRWEPWEKGEQGEVGPQGPPWRDWTWTWDMLASNNLSDLTDKIEARKNLEVFSKYEVWKKIENEVKKPWYIDFNDLANKPELWNFVNKTWDEIITWSKTFEKRWTAWVKFKNLNTNKTYEIWVNIWWEFTLWDTQNSKNRIRSKDNWFEIWAIPTTTEGQSDWWHSLVRKDYVDGKIREISNNSWVQVVWKMTPNSQNSFLEFNHNLNLRKEDIENWKYQVKVLKNNYDYTRILEEKNLFLIWWRESGQELWKVCIDNNKLYLYNIWNEKIKSILIFKNY